jgi:hypothetical protein
MAPHAPPQHVPSQPKATAEPILHHRRPHRSPKKQPKASSGLTVHHRKGHHGKAARGNRRQRQGAEPLDQHGRVAGQRGVASSRRRHRGQLLVGANILVRERGPRPSRTTPPKWSDSEAAPTGTRLSGATVLDGGTPGSSFSRTGTCGGRQAPPWAEAASSGVSNGWSWTKAPPVMAAAAADRRGVGAAGDTGLLGRRVRAKRPPMAGSAMREARAAAAAEVARGAGAVAAADDGAETTADASADSFKDGGAWGGRGAATASWRDMGHGLPRPRRPRQRTWDRRGRAERGSRIWSE